MPRKSRAIHDEFASGVNIRTCLYVAGILGLAALVNHSGLGAQMGAALLPLLPLSPESPASSFGTLVALTSVLNFTVTANGVPALFTPLAEALAKASGLPLVTVLMTQVIAYATPLLPYQASPIVVAMGMGRVSARDGMKLCLALATMTFIVLVPLDYAWFRLLGWLPSP